MAEHKISEAREEFASIINRVSYTGERVRLTRHGKAVAAVVPVADAEFLESLEDELDLDLVRQALADPDNATPIPWEDVKRRLSL
ncbi:MAG: type II toxin-antitoxin system prevent-host-death family antitoxin [Chloroflexota bacterium]